MGENRKGHRAEVRGGREEILMRELHEVVEDELIVFRVRFFEFEKDDEHLHEGVHVFQAFLKRGNTEYERALFRMVEGEK